MGLKKTGQRFAQGKEQRYLQSLQEECESLRMSLILHPESQQSDLYLISSNAPGSRCLWKSGADVVNEVVGERERESRHVCVPKFDHLDFFSIRENQMLTEAPPTRHNARKQNEDAEINFPV